MLKLIRMTECFVCLTCRGKGVFSSSRSLLAAQLKESCFTERGQSAGESFFEHGLLVTIPASQHLAHGLHCCQKNVDMSK